MHSFQQSSIYSSISMLTQFLAYLDTILRALGILLFVNFSSLHHSITPSLIPSLHSSFNHSIPHSIIPFLIPSLHPSFHPSFHHLIHLGLSSICLFTAAFCHSLKGFTNFPFKERIVWVPPTLKLKRNLEVFLFSSRNHLFIFYRFLIFQG